MTRRTLIAAFLMIAAAPVMPGLAQGTPLIDGQVTKIDESANKITIRHGPIPKFDMDEGMTMVFAVQDPAMLKAVKVGDKVRFDADTIRGRFTVTKIEKAK